jgi:hypothetical protein
MWHSIKRRVNEVLGYFGVLGICAVWLGIGALCIPTIRPHFISLLYRSLVSFTHFKGTTPWGFISSDLVQPILLLVFFVVLLHQSHGGDAVKVHWTKEGIIGLKSIGLLVVFYYLPIFLWKGVHIVYDDHQTLVAKIQSLSADNAQLRTQLSDTTTNAERQCEQAKDKTIQQLQKERNAVCYRPDRRLLPEDREHLFLRLEKLAQELAKSGKTPTIRIYAINCDRESSNFAYELQKIFQDAGWTIKFPVSEQEKKEAQEQYDWVSKLGSVTGVVIFDKNAPTGYSAMLMRGMLAEVNIADGSPVWGSGLKDMPHLQEPILWVGYKPTYP